MTDEQLKAIDAVVAAARKGSVYDEWAVLKAVDDLAAEVRLLRRHVLMLALAIRQAHEATESAQVVAAALAPDLAKHIPDR